MHEVKDHPLFPGGLEDYDGMRVIVWNSDLSELLVRHRALQKEVKRLRREVRRLCFLRDAAKWYVRLHERRLRTPAERFRHTTRCVICDAWDRYQAAAAEE